MHVINVGLAQYAFSESAEDNRQRAIEATEQAAEQGADIICLPELCHTPYFCKEQDPRWHDYAEPAQGDTVVALQAVAKARSVVLVVPYFEHRAPGLSHNSAAVIDADGSLLGQYRKLHIPQDPGFEEKFYFTPGDLGTRVWKTRKGIIGVLICWDQWFPEAARLTALGGAEILFYPTAIGWLPEEKAEFGAAQHHAWETVQCGHAVANGCHVVAVNRIGTEGFYKGLPATEFWGQSFVADPYGQVLHRMGTDQAGTAVVPVDLEAQQQTRRIWPFFRDRRVDAYDGLLKRWDDAHG